MEQPQRLASVDEVLESERVVLLQSPRFLSRMTLARGFHVDFIYPRPNWWWRFGQWAIFGFRWEKLLVLVAVALGGCNSGGCPPKWGVVSRVESEARHNVQWSVGPRCTWASGAYAQVLGGKRERVEEPSTRGESEEYQFAVEAFFPVGR